MSTGALHRIHLQAGKRSVTQGFQAEHKCSAVLGFGVHAISSGWSPMSPIAQFKAACRYLIVSSSAMTYWYPGMC